MTQTIDVSGAATQIDTGTVHMTLSAWTGGWSNKFDAAVVYCTTTDASGVTQPGIYDITNPPSFPPQRSFQTGTISRSGTWTVPTGTRSITVSLYIQGQDGSSPSPGTTAYVDNISLILQ